VEDAADRLGLQAHTLTKWLARWKEDRLRVKTRGRKPLAPDRKTHRDLLELFTLMGPEVPVSFLENLFPGVSRRELARHRDLWLARARKKKAVLIHALRFTRPGRVWAADFGHPPVPIDDLFPHFLPVRDLASGSSLLALPALTEDSPLVCQAFRALFRQYGAPLVMKIDNGPPFRADLTKALLREFHVQVLYSPPCTPEYNGAAETGVGSLKTFAHYESARHDRPGEWTCDDLEAARLRGNQIGHPFGRSGLTPDEAWARRTPVTDEERRLFAGECDRQREKEKTARGLLPLLPLSAEEQNSVDRVAIGRALIELGYLTIRRRRISPPISSKFHAKNSA
jgi:transposase InsO family protein